MLVTATIYVMLNLVADMLYVLVNPRLRVDQRMIPKSGSRFSDKIMRQSVNPGFLDQWWTSPSTRCSRRTTPRSESAARRALRCAAVRRKARCSGLAIIALFVAAALLAPLLAPLRPDRAGLDHGAPAAVLATHWFGTDEVGRDIRSRASSFAARAPRCSPA